jgi:hypothetical protein
LPSIQQSSGTRAFSGVCRGVTEQLDVVEVGLPRRRRVDGGPVVDDGAPARL